MDDVTERRQGEHVTEQRHSAEYVRVDMAYLRRQIVARLKPGYKASTYAEGWNDGMYLVLDLLDGHDGQEVGPCPACGWLIDTAECQSAPEHSDGQAGT